MRKSKELGKSWLIIRRAKESDLSATERIERASFNRRVAYSRRRLLRLIRGPSLAAVVGGAVVGYIAVRGRGGRGYIVSAAVSPHMRGLGIGEALVRRSLSMLRRAGFRSCALHVNAGRAGGPARVLYRKLGFEARGRREGWYDDGSPAYYMTRSM